MISDEGCSSEVQLRKFMFYINFVLRKQSLYLEFSTPNQYRIICTKVLIVIFKVVTVNITQN
jgi:hypothetical protein